MPSSFSAAVIDAARLLASFWHVGTVVTLGMFLVCAILAMRCQGRCREDEIFRLHVM